MPQEDRPVQVMSLYHVSGAPPTGGSELYEIGAHGEVAELLGVHYSLRNLNFPASYQIAVGLSSDPRHELTPPATILAFMANKSIYGSMVWDWDHSAVGTGYVNIIQFVTKVIPLYGLTRPRRQVLVVTYAGATISVYVRAEVYYRPLSVGKVAQETIDRKYGLYRRS